MSRVIEIESAITVDLVSYSGSTTAITVNGTTSNGAHGSGNTTYASFTGTTRNTTGYTYYTFGSLSIPSNATINSVSCVAKANVNSSSYGTAGLQLLANNTAKGSERTFTNTTASGVTISSTGTWSLSELNGTVKLRIRISRTNRNNAFYVRFYGATLTVNYSVNGTEYEVSFVNDTYDTTTDPSTTQYITSGGEQRISIFTPNVNEISVKDNNTDVTSSLEYVTVGTPENEVSTAPNATYGFELDSSDGYYKSLNKGVSQSAAVCRIHITASTQTTLTISFVNYAEATYDYGLIGQLDTALGTTSAVTNDSTIWIGSASTMNSSTVRTTGVTIPSGYHFIDIKFRKDQATDSYNDAFWFKYSLSETVLDNPYYRYTISNISADHVITLDDIGGTFYDVNASSSYAGATITPATQSIKEGRSATVYVEVDHLYEIVAKDNGTVIQLPEPVDNTSTEFIPSSFNQTPSSYSNSQNTGNGLTNTGSTTYALFSAVTTANATVTVVYDFDCSSIPVGAVIDSVTCAFNGRVSNATYLPTCHAQLYSGNVAKGSQSANINATQSTRTFDGGSWTREELQDANIRVIAQRGSSTSAASVRFYGANLLVEYHVPCSYTIQNVQTAHTITIEEAPYYTVTVNNPYSGATFTVDPVKGYTGLDVNVRIEVADIDEIKVFDNGTDIMSNIVFVGSGVYRYTINAIAANHTITVQESQRYQITASSTYSAVTITPASASVIEGHSQIFTIEGDEDTDLSADITLLDNNVDVTSQMTRAMGESGTTSVVLGTFDQTNSDYLDVYTNSSNVTYYETNAEGHGCDYGIANSGSTRSSFYPATGVGSELAVFYNFGTVTGIPENATITNVSSRAAVAPAYNGAGYSEMDVQLCIGTTPVGEPTPISSASTDANEHVINGGSGWTVSDLANAKIRIHGIRNGTNSNNDDTGKRDNINICGADLVVTYQLPGGYLYTVSNVQTGHTLVVNEVPATYYNVTASSSYAEATVTPATQSVRNNHVARVQISAASIYDIVVKDNGTNVTSELVQNETGFTYTTAKITAQHTITVEESESFTITASSEYQDATISPATQSVRQGMSAVTYIEAGNADEISVKDNGVEVGDKLVLSTPGETFTASGILDTFDEANSQYVGIYSTYESSHAEHHSSADGIASSGSTRSAFYPATGVGSELAIYYDFESVSGVPENAVITNVSANVAISTAYSGQGYSDVYVQLCIGTTPVGEATHPEIGANVAPVSARTVTVNGGSGWTMSDVENAKVLLYGVRNDTNSNNDTGGTRDNLCMHGADIIVTYTDGETFNGYTYTIQNVQTAHTVVITENPRYTVTSQSNVYGVTVSPASETVYGRQSVTVTIDGDITGAVVLDNNIDVTTQLRTLNATSHTYTIASVVAPHTIVVTEPGAESDYIKVGGAYKKVLGYYKKVNGAWVLIEKTAFDEQVSSGLIMYGGVVENLNIGEVTESSGALNIVINDDSLQSGTYRMVYEDANREPLSGVTEITQFTIS